MRDIVLKIIRVYQICCSPYLGPCCRFDPTCSHYGYEAILRFGIFRGCALTLRRLLKCHPFHHGGLDPVPKPK